MKKTITMLLLLFSVIVAMAQTLPAGATSTGVTFKAPSTQYPADGLVYGEIYEIWTYNGEDYYVCRVCKPNIPNPITPIVPTADANLSNSNTNTVTAYNDRIEQMKAEAMVLEAKAKAAQVEAEIAYNQRMAQIAQDDLERQKAADKVTKRQGGWQTFGAVMGGLGLAGTGTGTIMMGDAAQKGKLGTNIFQTILGSTITNPVNPGGPLMGSTTNTSTPVIIDNQGSPQTGGTVISNTDPRWNPFWNTNTGNGFFGINQNGPLSGSTRVIIN